MAQACTHDLSCTPTDHIEYLPREEPVYDQWGASYFVSSTKPEVVMPASTYYFHADRLLAEEAEQFCLDAGMELANMGATEKMKDFETQLLAAAGEIQSSLSASKR